MKFLVHETLGRNVVAHEFHGICDAMLHVSKCANPCVVYLQAENGELEAYANQLADLTWMGGGRNA